MGRGDGLPRGRIHLITQILDGQPGTAATATHLDRCLGCMACVPACPSGVRSDRLIEAAREWAQDAPDPDPAITAVTAGSAGPTAAGTGATVAGADAAGADPSGGPVTGGPWRARRGWARPGPARGRPAPPAPPPPDRALPARSRRNRAVRRAIFETFPYPQRLRVLIAPLRVAQRIGADRLLARSDLVTRLAPRLAAALKVAPATRGRAGRSGRASAGRETALPERIPARGERRAVVGMLTGCVQQVFFPEVNAAAAPEVLAAEGCDVIVARGQGCCGALSLRGGRRAEAAAFARRTIEAFEQASVDAINDPTTPASSASAMKGFGPLLADDPDWAARAAALSSRVADFGDAGRPGPGRARHPLPLTAVYQVACHLGHAQAHGQPRELLAGIPELRLAEVGDGGTCCGSAGIYNLVQPQTATALGARKAQSVWGAGGELLVSANPGCAMQISAALRGSGDADAGGPHGAGAGRVAARAAAVRAAGRVAPGGGRACR